MDHIDSVAEDDLTFFPDYVSGDFSETSAGDQGSTEKIRGSSHYMGINSANKNDGSRASNLGRNNKTKKTYPKEQV